MICQIRWTVFVFLSLSLPVHAAEICSCPGKSIASYKEGDGTPLYWSFEAFLVQEGGPNSPPLICYDRNVRNPSPSNVLNIRWEVAGYFRRAIPAKDSNRSCPTLAGELSTTIKNGPLHYGVSSEHYDTTVHPPKDGWSRQTSANSSGADFPIIRSGVETSIGKDKFADIVIYSYVTFRDQSAILNYEVYNHGDQPARLLINIPIVGEMEKLPFLYHSEIKANSGNQYSSKISGAVAVQPATVVVSNAETKEAVALDVIGVYAPIEGKPRYSEPELIALLRP